MKIEDSYSVNLRKLSLKSTIGFGRYSEMKVGNIIKVDLSYLAWVYFNQSKITFLPEILETIGIVGDHVIDKPGTSQWGHRNWKRDFYRGDDESKLKIWHDKQRRDKQYQRTRNSIDKSRFSKGNLMHSNHGKSTL